MFTCGGEISTAFFSTGDVLSLIWKCRGSASASIQVTGPLPTSRPGSGKRTPLSRTLLDFEFSQQSPNSRPSHTLPGWRYHAPPWQPPPSASRGRQNGPPGVTSRRPRQADPQGRPGRKAGGQRCLQPQLTPPPPTFPGRARARVGSGDAVRVGASALVPGAPATLARQRLPSPRRLRSGPARVARVPSSLRRVASGRRPDRGATPGRRIPRTAAARGNRQMMDGAGPRADTRPGRLAMRTPEVAPSV
ncbi:uncharacterized protein LOC132692165 [Panthera onca]